MTTRPALPRTSSASSRSALTRSAVAVLGGAALVVALAGCTGGGDGDASPSPTPSSTAAAAPAVTDIQDDPGTAPDFVGALQDVQQTACELDGGAYTVTGTAANPTDAAQHYRIYVSLLDGDQATLGLTQVDLDSVAAGETAEWEAQLAVDSADLTCVLRVERFAA